MWSPFFICGCPRSGTSALRNVFNNDVRFAIGMERFYYKAAKNFSLEHKLFEKERFFSLQTGDTFWNEISMYDGMKPNFECSIYRGDKIPKLYYHFDKLFKELPDTKVVFIVRDIVDVAASYNARANNLNDKNWSREQNFKVAVDDWNASLVSLYQYLYEKKCDVYPIFYEDFFSKTDSIEGLYKNLGIAVSKEVRNDFSSFVEKYKNLKQNKKSDVLSEVELDYINKNANFKLYRWIKKHVS